MIENDLERLLRTAQDEPGLQPVLFRALLDATVYALMPRPDQGPTDGRVRFLQWERPDGVTVIPCFTSELKAQLSAQSKARVAAIDGRQLMEVTRGATLHLDPNDFSCTLSPADISALLTYGALRIPEHEVITELRLMRFTAPKSSPAAMLSSSSVLYDTLGFVARGFLLEMRAPDAPEHVQTLLVALELDGERDAHRAARDSTTVIQETYHGPLPIDLIVLDDVSEMGQLIRSEFAPFYSRAMNTKANEPRMQLQ